MVLKRIIKARSSEKVFGFNNDELAKKKSLINSQNTEPRDLIKYGIIPEACWKISCHCFT